MILLVVDDDTLDRRAVVRAIRARHPEATVREAEGAAEAYALLDRGDIDCVLLDYHLPGADGLEVLARISATTPEVPVIALTGRGDQHLAVALMKAGARDYLEKHLVAPETLEQSIRHALTMADAERERRALLAREQAARQEAQAANRAKDEFLATLSHELRTPLNSILGWARLLNTGTLAPEVTRKALTAIERNAMIQTKLIEDLLDISRVISGKLQVDFEPVHLTSVAASVIESLQYQAADRGIQLRSSVMGAEALVMGDAARLNQVVTNLVTNALKFTNEGGTIDVTVTFEREAARLRVSDNGVGIDPAFLPHVFDRFRQAETGATRTRGGLGLGLAIVRHLVELHGGHVTASSAGPGTGATFELTLPVERATTTLAPPRPAAEGITTITGIRVLIIDDDRDARALVRTVLEQHGAIVQEAANCADAIAAAQAVRPDVVVSDIAMPDQDGYTLMRQLRTLYPDRPFAAIAVTAFASLADRQRALDAGYDCHMSKPVDPLRLLAAVGADYTGGGTPAATR